VLGQTSHFENKKQLAWEKNKLVPIGMDDQQNFSHLIKKTIQLVNGTLVTIILVWVTNQTSISVKEVCT
jgi:PDZ domain-containing secreted protein